MLSLLSIVFIFLALILIECLFISWSLSVPLSLKNILRFIKITASPHHDYDERIEKRDTMGEKEKREKMPKHVAVMLDGNGRWAKKRGLGTSKGNEAGIRNLMENAKDFFSMGIDTISLFAFSTENWGRPEDEVNSLMELFEERLKLGMPYFQRYKIKVSVIGNRAKIPVSLLDLIRAIEETTESYREKHLILAIDYGGRFDILQACKSLAKKAKDGLIGLEDIDENLMEKELMTKCTDFPNPDLLIRTSGEQRISNFFLWQSAYTELYFPPVLWPDFGPAECLEALSWYQHRQRRFGRRV